MPVKQVLRAVLIDDLALTVSAWRYICDGCGTRETFPDYPMPDGRDVTDASRRGWMILGMDDEACACPTCACLKSNMLREKLARECDA